MAFSPYKRLTLFICLIVLFVCLFVAVVRHPILNYCMDSLRMSHHAPQPHSSPRPFISAFCAGDLSPRSPQRKQKIRRLLLEAGVCHTVYTFAQTAFLAHVHGSESVIWMEASGFCCSSTTGASLGSSWTSCCCHEDPATVDLQDQPLHVFLWLFY